MTGKIYLRQPDGSLRAMCEAPFDREDVLQKLLEDYPDLLAGEQMNPEEPRRWLLIGREQGVPDEVGASNRWSVDHLFLDQEGVPTLVEVKRSSDTRIRREVIGQMLDYAANAVLHWPIESLRMNWEQQCEKENAEPTEVILDLLGRQGEGPEVVETFWENVKTNLQAGRVRMVFLADVIPSELRRVVEFLNGQMDPAEVVAVEVKQFIGDGLQSLVPRVLGHTATAQRRKAGATRPGRQWDEGTFLEDLEARHGSGPARTAKNLLSWVADRGHRVWWGKGSQNGSFFPMALLPNGKESVLFSVWTFGSIEVGFQHLQRRPPFDLEENRKELLSRLRASSGVDLPADSHKRRPNFPLKALEKPEALEGFKQVMDWAYTGLRNGRLGIR